MIRCAGCGCGVTAEEHVKKSGLRFVYYRCTRRRQPRCTEPAIPLREAEEQIHKFLTTITIPEDFHRWALARLDRCVGKEVRDRSARKQSLQTAIEAASRQIENLTKLRVRDQISDDEFLKEREALQREKLQVSQRLVQEVELWFEPEPRRSRDQH